MLDGLWIPIIGLTAGRAAGAASLTLLLAAALHAQQPAAPPATPEETPSQVAESVEVTPAVADTSIAQRLARILNATGWFRRVDVRVDQGLVFLEAHTDSQERKTWAGDLARNTQGVVAVVNRINVDPPAWSFLPAWNEIQRLGSEAMKLAPLMVLGLLIVVATWLTMNWVTRTSRAVLRQRLDNQLLRSVASKALAIPVLLLGFYVALRVAGLTGLAVTVLGGTGLIGLIIGVAFRDIAENFLASLMISIQSPFAHGDRIAVAGHEGFVQSVNTRSTLLMTLEGNHVQIPNATIYKETITNYTANPNTRFDFTVGIGYDDPIEEAQTIARSILSEQVGLVEDPEPWILVEALGAATVNLRIYFWVHTAKFNGLKVRSAVIRKVKQAFEGAGISMPDESREVVFPKGVPVRMIEEKAEVPPGYREKRPRPVSPAAQPSGEGDLASEAADIAQQAQRARKPEGGPDLLTN